MPDGERYLQTFRNGNRTVSPTPLLLPDGAQGNIQTLSAMAEIVREDAPARDIRAWIMRDLLGGTSATLDSWVDAAYRHCRDLIVYRDELDDAETVSDLWSCEYFLDAEGLTAVGDCAVKSVALATMIGAVSSLKIQPWFIAIRQDPAADFFNHVYVGMRWPDGRFEALDATPPDARPGQYAGSVEQLHYYIWKDGQKA
jgi:hypothetical protein